MDKVIFIACNKSFDRSLFLHIAVDVFGGDLSNIKVTNDRDVNFSLKFCNRITV